MKAAGPTIIDAVRTGAERCIGLIEQAEQAAGPAGVSLPHEYLTGVSGVDGVRVEVLVRVEAKEPT